MSKEQSVIVVNHVESYATWEKFLERFPKNPVLERWRTDISILGVKRTDGGVYMRILTMHQDEQNPFLVEMPWSEDARKYAEYNKV